MYPANKKMDGVQSATGVFYQAMPAVGADGKNIMKLIPVQMVNGEFFQTQISKPKMDPTPQKAVSINIASAPVQKVKKAALDASVTQQIIRKVSLMNALPHEVGSELCNSLNKRPLQQKIVNLLPKAPPMATAAANCEKPRFSSQLPVTVKSPALPRGQYLQIPPNAQVRTVPGSELPPGIKKQIFTSSASSPPASVLPSVVYVSPITTVNQSVMPPSDSARHLPKLLPKASNKSSCEPLQKHLKLIPKVAQRPNSPLKWMVEEEESSVAPSLDPLNSLSMTSEILLAVKERENAFKRCDVVTKPISQLSQGKGRQGQENALVMCNGKVFFVAKKCSPSLKMGTNDSPAAATKSYQSTKTMAPSSQQSLESIAPEKRQDLSIIISDESDEVIDLCDDDDAQDDLSQQTASVNVSTATHLDEDNVIFVSYIPPKSESGSAQDVIANTQKAAVAEADQRGTSSSKSPEGAMGGEVRAELSALRGRKPDQSALACTVKNLGGSAEVSMSDEGANISSQQSTSSQRSEDDDVDAESPAAASSRGICSQIEEDTQKMESSVSPATSSLLTPQSSQMADHLLRQIFKIMADVKICLQRIDDVSALPVPAEPLQSESMSDHQEPTSGLKLPDPCSLQQTDSDKGLISVKAVTEQELSADPATSSPHPHIGPVECSHFKHNSSPLPVLTSEQKLLTPCDVETEPVMGFVEPIDEDFLSSDENDSQDTDAAPQTPTCVDLNVNTSRMGRTRKRTMCPCCIPGTEVPAVKSSAKAVEPEKWAWKAEKTSKKGGRTKAVRKDEKTFGKISCLTAKNKQKCKTSEIPAKDSLSTTSMDSEELARLEKIKRLKEILRDKEAALELMRKNS